MKLCKILFNILSRLIIGAFAIFVCCGIVTGAILAIKTIGLNGILLILAFCFVCLFSFVLGCQIYPIKNKDEK